MGQTAENQTDETQDLEDQNKPTPQDDGQGQGSEGKTGNQVNTKSDDDDEDMDQWEPSKVKDYVKKLRNENKSHRHRAKELEGRLGKIESGLKSMFGEEDDDTDPETKISQLQQMNDAKELRLAILESAVDYGIQGKDGIEYFEFLVSKQLQGLDDGEELSDEDFQSIAEKVQSIHGGGAANTSSKTTVSTGSDKPKTGTTEEIGLDDFMQMTTMQKSELFRTNEATYNRLMKEARDKKLFV